MTEGQCFPGDIERLCVRRLLAPLQDVEPPVVVGLADAHMIGNEIKDQAEIVLLSASLSRANASSPPSSGLSRP